MVSLLERKRPEEVANYVEYYERHIWLGSSVVAKKTMNHEAKFLKCNK